MRVRMRLMAAVLAGLLLSGCWSRRELTDVSFAGAMGIDWVEGEYQVTVNINFPKRQSGEQGGATKNIWTLSTKAPSPDAALAKMDQIMMRSLTLAHIRTVVFGEEMARRGIAPAMDFLLRSVEIRPTAWIAVTNGQASDLLSTRPRQDMPSEGPLGYHDAAQNRSSITPARRLVEVAHTLQEEGISLTLPLFRRGNQKAPESGQAELEGSFPPREEEADEIVYGGAGVFRDDKLVAWLTPEAARGQLWGIDRIVHGVISAECPDPKPDQRIVFRLRKGSGRARVVAANGGKLKGTIAVRVDADVNDVTCEDRMILDGDVSRLKAVLAARVQDNIKKALEVERETGADIFGFGQNLYRRSPAAFRSREKNWPDIVRELPVTVTVDANVERLGQLNLKYRWRSTR